MRINQRTINIKENDFLYKEYKKVLNDLEEAKIDINEYLNREDNFNINPYIRITIVDNEGNKAHTRAYLLNELK